LKTAVCQGIANAFKMLCDRVNIPSLVVLGDAGGRHAWNIVRIEGRFYQVDCTWILKNSINLTIPYKRYQYLNITDEIIGQNHTPDDHFLPKCSSLRSNPYRIKGFCCKDTPELYDLALKHAINGEKRFAFLCLSGVPEEDERMALANRMANAVGGMIKFYFDKYYIGFEVQRSN